MESIHLAAQESAARVTRVEAHAWHAVEDGRIVGRGDLSIRPDGRVFISVDAWQQPVFDLIAQTILSDVPGPLRTLLDESDEETLLSWRRLGLQVERRYREYALSTRDRSEEQDAPPSGVSFLPFGADPRGSVVAVAADEHVGLVRFRPVARDGRFIPLARIGSVAVRADWRRRGIARALLTKALAELERSGVETAFAEVDDSDQAAVALFEGLGAARLDVTLELVRDEE